MPCKKTTATSTIVQFIYRGLLLLFLIAVGITTLPQKTYAQTGFDAQALAEDIDEFFNAGAAGYLVWQYGGDYEGRQIAVDQYSFYRNQHPEICDVLQEKAEAYPDKFIGVNINNIGADEFTDGTAVEHLTWLRQNCGVSVVRIFAKIEGASGVQNALEAAQSAGVEIIVAIGDYSNGGGGMPQGAPWPWYESGYQGAYQDLVDDLIALGSHNALWGYELANEPHCGGTGTPEAIAAYSGWGADIGAQLAAVTNNVGYGQMASQNSTRCDSPGPGDFRETNSINQITVTSAHYYNEEEKANALTALSQSQELGKLFYIGEAPPGGSATTVGEELQGYDLSEFPEYSYDPTYYYLHPVKGVHPESSPAPLVSVARSDLANQGYEAYCAAESSTIQLDVDTRELIDRFLRSNPAGIRVETESEYLLNSSGGQFPLFRDTSGKKFLTTSIEEFFGFKDTYTDESYSVKELNTAPINSLLSQEQKCIQGVDILTNTQLMCERLEEPANCAPLGNEIPGTSYTVSTLIEDVKEVIPGHRDGQIVDECKQLFATDDPELDKVKRGILNVPLYIDRSYRFAFLVASIEQRPRSEAFNFFSYSDSAKPRDEVLIVAFKIPDILTNKGGGETAGHQFFNDAATLTRDVLVPKNFRFSEDEDNPGYDKETRDRRTIVEQNAQSAALQTEESRIYCVEGAPNSRGELDQAFGSPACKDLLGKAVVDIINGNSPNCSNLETEPVQEIFEEAFIIPPGREHTSRMFNEDYGFGTAILNYFFLQNDTPQVARSQFTTWFDIIGNEFDGAEDESTEVDFYLVYPVGYELESVTEVLKNTFFTREQIATLEENNNTNRFETQHFGNNFDGGGMQHSFQDDPAYGDCEEITETIINPETGEREEVTYYDCWETFNIDIREQSAGGLSVLGAKLGYWMRNIQRSVNSYFSNASAFITSCKTTEEFLLGNCTGGATRTTQAGTGPSGVPNASCEVETAREGVWQGHGITAFPEPIQEIMLAAANQYNMPVCVLTAVASVEGSGMTQLTNSEAEELTRPWQNSPEQEISQELYDKINCAPNFANAAGPMQMLPNSFNSFSDASDSYLGSHNNSVCNATDAIFAAAAFLAEGRLPIYGYDSPPSTTEWNTGRIYCAAGQTYYGSCALDAPTCNNLGTNYCDFVLNHCRGSSGVATDVQCSQYFEEAETYQ